MDKITVDRIKTLHPDVISEVQNHIYPEICAALKGKAICRFAYTTRTFEEQNLLYSLGRTRPGKIVTNAKGGQSYHNFSLAIDIVLLKDKDGNGTYEEASWETDVDFDGDGIADWMEIVAIFKKYGWVWGGEFKSIPDKPHFEKHIGMSLSDLRTKYPKGI